MRDASSSHKPGSLIWPWAVKRPIQRTPDAAAPAPRTEARRWTIMGLK